MSRSERKKKRRIGRDDDNVAVAAGGDGAGLGYGRTGVGTAFVAGLVGASGSSMEMPSSGVSGLGEETQFSENVLSSISSVHSLLPPPEMQSPPGVGGRGRKRTASTSVNESPDILAKSVDFLSSFPGDLDPNAGFDFDLHSWPVESTAMTSTSSTTPIPISNNLFSTSSKVETTSSVTTSLGDTSTKDAAPAITTSTASTIPIPTPPRFNATRRVCDACALAKTRCVKKDGEESCQSCIKSQKQCVFSVRRRRGPLISQGTLASRKKKTKFFVLESLRKSANQQ